MGNKIKTLMEFLGVPTGSIGEITSFPTPGSALIKFDCKTETVMLPYPPISVYMELPMEIAV